MHTTDYSPPSARRAARPAATDDFALAVLVQRVVRSRVPDRTATSSRQPQSTESLEADDHTIEPTERLGVHGFHPDVLPPVYPGGDH